MIRKSYSFDHNGVTVDTYTLSNKLGMEMDIITRGATITRLTAPDRNGKMSDVIVGYATPEEYMVKGGYYGAFIGRYGNRIGDSKFTLNGVEYKLYPNNGKNNLHGGKVGFDKKIMDAVIDGDKITFSYTSPDGEEGFPGTLEMKVTYALTDEGDLVIDYWAKSDKDTVCNLTNHAYFNIGDDETILDQVLDINSSRMTPVDDELITHNDYLDTDGTPYSFKGGVKLGENMFSSAHMIALCGGFDFNYCLDRKTENELEFCASVYDEKSGRYMECWTTLPGVQLYTTNLGKGTFAGKKLYPAHAALCLETQCYPNSPNCPDYPTTTLKAGDEYITQTVYKFRVK